MKGKAVLLILILAALCASAFAETYYARQIDYCNEYVTLRSKADTSSRGICTVDIGEVVMASSYNSQFSYCCYNGKFGYILNRYLSSNIQPWSEGTFHIGNCNEWVSLRTMPISDASVRTRIPLGAHLDQVYYHDGSYTPGNFVFVRYNGMMGFVKWAYVVADYYPGWQ